jgi:iron(III) transport system substrate-binding protein
MAVRRILIPLGMLAVLLILAACQPPVVPQPQQAASTELNVLCTPQVEWCEGMKAEFEAAHPDITVNFVRMSSGESLTRLRNEKDNPQFDIWWGGPIDSFIAAKQEGLLEKYDSPNYANIINPDLMADPDHYWVGIYVGSLGFATNTNSGVTPPTSWDDLLKPEMEGNILIAHPSSSGTSYTHLCTRLQMLGEEAGWEWERQFAQNVLQYTKSGAAPARFVGQGEAAVAVVFSHDIVNYIEQGQPLALTFPEEGTGFEIGGMGIIKGAKHLDAAQKWFDWALEPETQELGPKYAAYQAPTVKGATPSKPELLDVNLIDYDFIWCGEHKTEFVDKFTNEIAGADSLKED